MWGWTPFVDPDPMLSYFTCAQVTTDAEADRLQRRQLVQPRVRRAVRAAELELDRATRIEIVHEMLRLLLRPSATYVVLFEDADLQAYRTDRFEGWTRQPAETGPVLFTNTRRPTSTCKPIEGGAGGDDGGMRHRAC